MLYGTILLRCRGLAKVNADSCFGSHSSTKTGKVVLCIHYLKVHSGDHILGLIVYEFCFCFIQTAALSAVGLYVTLGVYCSHFGFGHRNHRSYCEI